jgi:hypothetical protein
MDWPLSEIADQLERLAREIRGAAERGPAPVPEARSPRRPAARTAETEQQLEDAVEEAKRRLHAEADRVVAAAVRALDAAPATAILEAEREARERILATTESVCARIEAVDRAQERVAAALSRLEPRRPDEARTGDG